jgi:hypothetical protein
MSNLEFDCPACKQRLNCPPRSVAKRVRCGRCNHAFRPVDVIERQTAIPAIPADEEPRKESPKEETRKETALFGSVGEASKAEKPAPPRPPKPPQRAKAAPANAPIPSPAPIPAPRISDKGGTVMLDEEHLEEAVQALASHGGTVLLGGGSGEDAEEAPPAGIRPRLFPMERSSDPQAARSSDAPEAVESDPEMPNSRKAMMPPESTLPTPSKPPPPAPPTPTQEALEEAAAALARASIEIVRPSRLSIYRLSKHRTTMVEIANVAQRMKLMTEAKLPRGVGLKISLSTAIGLIPVLLVALVLSSDSVRWVIAPFLFAVVCALLVYGGLRALPRLAQRLGPRELPGRAFVWVGTSLTFIACVAAVLTYGMSEATARLAVEVLPRLDVDVPERHKRPENKLIRADSHLVHPDQHMRVGPGVLYVPPNFHSTDGSFDVVLHFHGNTQLVEESVAEAGINALVHVTNLGLGSGRYESYFQVPTAYDQLIKDIEERAEKLGLKNPRIRRVALTAWSAGYGAIFYVLDRREDFGNIDTLLMMDSIHAGHLTSTVVDPRKMLPFVRFAKEAAEGKKLMVLTHSQIEPVGYASTTETADAILQSIGLVRTEVDPKKASPPVVTLEVAVRAMPAKANAWLEVITEAHREGLHVYG